MQKKINLLSKKNPFTREVITIQVSHYLSLNLLYFNKNIIDRYTTQLHKQQQTVTAKKKPWEEAYRIFQENFVDRPPKKKLFIDNKRDEYNPLPKALFIGSPTYSCQFFG